MKKEKRYFISHYKNRNNYQFHAFKVKKDFGKKSSDKFRFENILKLRNFLSHPFLNFMCNVLHEAWFRECSIFQVILVTHFSRFRCFWDRNLIKVYDLSDWEPSKADKNSEFQSGLFLKCSFLNFRIWIVVLISYFIYQGWIYLNLGHFRCLFMKFHFIARVSSQN